MLEDELRHEIISHMDYHETLTKRARGAIVGDIEATIKEVAEKNDIPIVSGRNARMRLASAAVRPVQSYNELNDAELVAVQRAVKSNSGALVRWLKRCYGEQLGLLSK